MTAVWQGYVLPPFLFLITDFIMRKSMNNPVFGIKWKHDRLTDLDFADGIALLIDAHNSLQDMTTRKYEQATKLGLCISCEKTKMMSVGIEQFSPVTNGQQAAEYVDNFPYLGSYISQIGDAMIDI